MTEFSIDPDIRKAKTLPSEFYTDERWFELSKERIFSRTWQFLGKSDDFSGLHPITLLPGILDEPLLLSSARGRVKCLSNVCTHRGKVLIEQPCRASLIRCSYHGRRFDLSGRFLSMPEFEGVEDFPGESDDLKQVPLTEFGPFIFISLSPAAPFERFVGDAGAVVKECSKELEVTSSKYYELNAHWALYCENYLEGFHIPFVHKSLNEIVDYGTYTIETFRFSSVQTGFDEAGAIAGKYLFIFPNLMFNFYPWGLSVNVVCPVRPDFTRVLFLTYVSDESKLGVGAGGDLHRIELEDEAVVESVQKGVRSRFYSHGRYSPAREQGTHHFHRLIAEFMK